MQCEVARSHIMSFVIATNEKGTMTPGEIQATFQTLTLAGSNTYTIWMTEPTLTHFILYFRSSQLRYITTIRTTGCRNHSHHVVRRNDTVVDSPRGLRKARQRDKRKTGKRKRHQPGCAQDLIILGRVFQRDYAPLSCDALHGPASSPPWWRQGV